MPRGRPRNCMTYYEVDLRLQHECPYSQFSRDHPTAVVSHWCNWSRDVLEIASGEVETPELRSAVRRMLTGVGAKTIRSTEIGRHVRLVLQHCACDALPPPTLPMIERRNCLNLQPMVYTKGWEWYRLVAFSDQDLRQLVRDLERRSRVELVARRRVPEGAIHERLMVSTGALLSGLTDRQVRALVIALDNGYYNLPRSASSVEIAHRLGTPRTSFVDHLRKGQNKVMQAIGPYLRMRTSGDYRR
jgi:predicted DNA binding protein